MEEALFVAAVFLLILAFVALGGILNIIDRLDDIHSELNEIRNRL